MANERFWRQNYVNRSRSAIAFLAPNARPQMLCNMLEHSRTEFLRMRIKQSLSLMKNVRLDINATRICIHTYAHTKLHARVVQYCVIDMKRKRDVDRVCAHYANVANPFLRQKRMCTPYQFAKKFELGEHCEHICVKW